MKKFSQHLQGLLRSAWFGRSASSARRRSDRRSGNSLESLEPREVLSVSAVFNPTTGALAVSNDGADSIALGTNQSGEVTLNGAALVADVNGTSANVAANSVTSLTVNGGDGDNSIDLSAVSKGRFNQLNGITVNGGGGADNIIGSSLGDVINGGEGNDTVSGGRGRDVIDGGLGLDELSGGNQNDTLNGGGGADTLLGGNGDDSLNGQDDADSLAGGSGSDQLNGQDGVDTLNGGNGHDSLNGGNEADWLFGGNGTDTALGEEGDDTLNGGNGGDHLEGGDGNDLVNGGTGTDFIEAGAGDDSVRGGQGNDTIYAGAGNDTVNSGAGDDLVFGGSGTDDLQNIGGGTDTVDPEGPNAEGEIGQISDSDVAADTVDENSPAGTTVGLTAFADDADLVDTVSYSLDDDAGGLFAIDSGTGVVTVAGALDAETASSHSVTVRATSTDGSSTTMSFIIAVTDVVEV